MKLRRAENWNDFKMSQKQKVFAVCVMDCTQESSQKQENYSHHYKTHSTNYFNNYYNYNNNVNLHSDCTLLLKN